MKTSGGRGNSRQTIWATLFVIFAFGARVQAAGELRLQFRDEKGQPVVVTRAELLWKAPGAAGKIPLKLSKEGLMIPLDAGWLKAHWFDANSRPEDLTGVFLYLQAKGFASICSHSIIWPGTTEAKTTRGPTLVTFPRGSSTWASKDGISQLMVIFRKPGRKVLHFINDEGKPVAGVKVDQFLFWSNDNPMGLLRGVEFLKKGSSGTDGRVVVPDGDFTHAFRVVHPKYYLLNRVKHSADPFLMIATLKSPETFVVMTTQKPPEFFDDSQ
jgi:hypothetical protein